MSKKTVPELIEVAALACSQSLTQFYQAHPNAPSIRKVHFAVDFESFVVMAPEKNFQNMIGEHFEASADLQRKLGKISAEIRSSLPELARTFSVEILVEAYISPDHGLYYKHDDTIVSINGITTWRPDVALKRLALLSGPYTRSETDPSAWIVFHQREGVMTSNGDRVIAGSLEEAIVSYSCLGMSDREHLAILDGDEEALERHLSGVSIIAEPDLSASDVLRASGWVKNAPQLTPDL